MQKKKLSEIEWQIINVIWRDEEVTVKEVHSALNIDKAYTTIQTYMERMVNKGFLAKSKKSGQNIYTSILDREQTRQKAVGSFLKNVFNNSLSNLAANLFDSSELTIDDLKEIKEIIDKKIEE
jgi:BlaI family penicillinase repressor